MKPFYTLPMVTAFGGGHGLAASLSALRQVTDQLTAVVTVADDGGSSGRLRAEFDCLPPGDLRMALAALCGDDIMGRQWAAVLQSRFPGDGDLAGHAIGNLLIAGVWQSLGDPVAGLDLVGRLLDTQGRVLPMALSPLEIEADIIGLDDAHPDEKNIVRGQAEIATTTGDVWHVRLSPPNPPACPEAVRATRDADFIVLGPGSWFTSVIPHLLVPDLAAAIVESKAKRILTLNIAPADETEGFTAARHLEVLAEHAPCLRLDVIVADDAYAGNDKHIARFAESLGAELVLADVAMPDGTARHDPLRLAAVYRELMS